MQTKLQIKNKCFSRISDTRWSCRYKNCKMVIENYSAIIHVLQEEIDNNHDKDIAQAIGMYIIFILFIIY